MPSRATSTRGKVPDWRTWLVYDYTRYWYALGVILLVVFGVGDLARVWQPLTAAEVAALVVLTVAIVALGAVGHVALWRPESRVGRGVRQLVRPLRSALSPGWRRLLRMPTDSTPDPALPEPQESGEDQDDGHEHSHSRQVE